MREQGLRTVQMWVLDVRAPGFVEEARRQSALVRESALRSDDQDFVEAISTDWDE